MINLCKTVVTLDVREFALPWWWRRAAPPPRGTCWGATRPSRCSGSVSPQCLTGPPEVSIDLRKNNISTCLLISYLQIFHERPLARSNARAEVVDEDGRPPPKLCGRQWDHVVRGDRGHGLWQREQARDVILDSRAWTSREPVICVLLCAPGAQELATYGKNCAIPLFERHIMQFWNRWRSNFLRAMSKTQMRAKKVISQHSPQKQSPFNIWWKAEQVTSQWLCTLVMQREVAWQIGGITCVAKRAKGSFRVRRGSGLTCREFQPIAIKKKH